VTYPQDQDYRASGGGPATDDDYPETLGDEDVAQAEPDVDDEDDDVVIERDVIVAEVIDEDDEDDTVQADPVRVGSAPAAATPTNGAATVAAAAGDDQLNQQWHDIQAGFVDDPQGAVRMAAKAADDALAALVTALRERQATLGSTETTEDTEVLRGALREYRQFCQGIEQIGRELPQPMAAH
jgi:hypothetical protein